MSHFLATVFANIRKQQPMPLEMAVCEDECYLQAQRDNFQHAYQRFQVSFYNTMRALQGKSSH